MGIFDSLQHQLGEWLLGRGPESDIVISTRVRLARNLVSYPFLTKASLKQRKDIEREVREKIAAAAIGEAEDDARLIFASIDETDPVERQCLVERHLISHDLASGKGGAVVLGPRETVSIMVNEEDHLRIQVLRCGLRAQEAWEQAAGLDAQLEECVPYAFSPQYGYLTACPTNCGTGLRISVMLHLPALVMTKQVDKVFQAVGKMSLAVRGLYGEGTQAYGDFYQISNQATLGRSEEDVLKQLSDVVPRLVAFERQLRETLKAESRTLIEDRIHRAYGMLRHARMITSEETMDLLSAVRMGVNMGLLPDLRLDLVNELFIRTQPAHLQKIEGRVLETGERDAVRAAYIRKRLAESN